MLVVLLLGVNPDSTHIGCRDIILPTAQLFLSVLEDDHTVEVRRPNRVFLILVFLEVNNLG